MILELTRVESNSGVHRDAKCKDCASGIFHWTLRISVVCPDFAPVRFDYHFGDVKTQASTIFRFARKFCEKPWHYPRIDSGTCKNPKAFQKICEQIGKWYWP